MSIGMPILFLIGVSNPGANAIDAVFSYVAGRLKIDSLKIEKSLKDDYIIKKIMAICRRKMFVEL